MSVTVVLLVCSYKNQEFVRIGYYVNNEYESEELKQNPPAEVEVNKLIRNILSDKPRVTRIPITWDGVPELPEPSIIEETDDYEMQTELIANEQVKLGPQIIAS